MSQDPQQNPYASGQSSRPPETSGEVAPLETSIPKWIGIMNIAFGSILLLCTTGYAMQVVVQGLFGASLAGNQNQFQEIMDEARQKQIQDLKEAESETEDAEIRESLRTEIESLEAEDPPQMPDIRKLAGLNDPMVVAAYMLDCGTGFILNLLLFAAGIGLLGKHEWGRKLTLWVSGLKIPRLIIVCMLWVFLIRPALSNGMTEFFLELQKMDPNAPQHRQPPMDQLKMVYSIMISVWAGILLVFGSIYPLVCLRLLRRPAVIQACQPEQQEIYQAELL